MRNEAKKYSLISVDEGNIASTAQVEETSGVRTTRSLVDGEETILVSSRQTSEDGSSDSLEPSLSADVDSEYSTGDPAAAGVSFSDESADAGQGLEGDEGVPFARMQAVIVVALVALIVIFFVYFNFLR